ncbi:MAG TPA: glycosyltransferase family 39 protein [Pyrinomonadaceae bacterium]|nr:glycosyltransferase family 39 protein [Pyrinomonadaceae bacterium]
MKREAVAPRMMRPRAIVSERDRALLLTLFFLVMMGLGLRLSDLSEVGFAEDEVNKVEAVRAYSLGDISPNAEHPMLMKLLMLASVSAAHEWNARSNTDISEEAAMRFPNALVGALTVIPIFLMTGALFDRRTALLAASLWAFGINAITYNRIAKEDTLLVFFMFFAFYFYLRAKLASGYDAAGKKWYYGLSGVGFGLMLASKYFPHYFGLNALYHHLVRVRKQSPGEPKWKTPRFFYALMLVAFLVVNPAILLPQTWHYLQTFTSGQLLKHSGYLFGEHLYLNTMAGTPFWGTPIYFYALFLLIKVPLPVLLAFIIGLVECFRRWQQPGHAFLLLMFLLWIVPYSLVGGKWLRYTLSLLPFVYMIAAVGIAQLVSWSVAAFKSADARRVQQVVTAIALIVFIAWPALTAARNAPHYAAYTNALGGGRTGYFFPHDEFYDDGMREAIKFVCERAPQGATIVHETPGVVRYYLEQYGRTDLQSRVLSDPNFHLADVKSPTYFILQRGRTYFENREKMEEVRARFQKIYDVTIKGASAAEVFAL